MKKQHVDQRAVIYQTKTGEIVLKQDIVADTVWASQAHIAEIFEVERSVITNQTHS